MKTVIFIGGTSFSGSTLLDMVLANDPHGFSCGEVHALFNPYRSHHIDPECGCGDASCEIWKQVLRGGSQHIYQTIFDLFPQVNFIVDSSKNQFWIKDQIQNLESTGISTKNVIIWKTPFEVAASFKKRNRLDDWERSWINYHRLYFSVVGNFRSVKYQDFAKTKNATLENLCNYLGIDYFENKYQYWNDKQHTLFGNNSAKVHLYEKETQSYNQARNFLENNADPSGVNYKKNYREIYYTEIEDQDLTQHVNSRMKRNEKLPEIVNVLKNRDVSFSSDSMSKTLKSTARFHPWSVYFIRMKRALQRLLTF